jgi:putative ABC transport system permease protein
MSTFVTELRHAFRRLAAAPGFTAVAAITLALGIGATTAIYSVVDATMLRPLPYADPARLLELSTRTATGGSRVYFNHEQFAALEARTDLFSGVALYDYRSGTLPSNGEPKHDGGLAIGGAMMSLLGVPPLLGRVIQPDDARAGAAPVIVLSYVAWRDQFGADPAVIGRVITFDGKPIEIVGVMPKSFTFLDGRRKFWVPLTEGTYTGRVLQVIARTRPEMTVAEALLRIGASTVPARASDDAATSAKLEGRTLGSRQLNAPVRTAILVLAGAVGMVLLIACANIANLLLVKNASREREVAVRAALGASRGRLLRQLFTEAALLAGLGGAVGLIVAHWTIWLLAAMAPPNLPFLSADAVGLDRRILVFASLLTIVTGLLFSVLPALKGSRLDLFEALKAGSRSATQTGQQERLRRGFIVLQLAVSCMLLIGAGLLSRTFVHLLRVDPGFDTARLAMITLQLPTWKYPTGVERRRFYDTLVERIAALPGVTGATLTGGVPPSGGNFSFGLTFEVEGKGVVLDDPAVELPNSAVPPDFFSVLGVPLKMGRTFADYASPGSEPVTVISEDLAARLWKGESPIGKRFRMGTGPNDRWYTVVGVSGGVYEFRYANTTERLAYYVPSRRDVAGPVQNIIVRTAGEPAAIIPLLRQQIRELDPSQPIWRLGTIESQYAEFFAVPGFYMFLMTTFAAMGVAIAAVGLYGVLAYAIAQRTRELGVRMALGASKTDVLLMVFSQGARVTAAGVAVGLAGSVFVTRSLESMLVDVSRLDPIAYVAVAVVLTLVAAAACWIPARRATNVDPIVALRYE